MAMYAYDNENNLFETAIVMDFVCIISYKMVLPGRSINDCRKTNSQAIYQFRPQHNVKKIRFVADSTKILNKKKRSKTNPGQFVYHA